MEMVGRRGLDYWRKCFSAETSDIFEIIENGIMIAAADCPNEFRLRRDRIAELLFCCESKRCVGCDNMELCVPVVVQNSDDFEDDVGRRNCGGRMEGEGDRIVSKFSYGVAEALSDEIEQGSQLVGEVLRIKEILSNSRDESESVLYDSLRRLQLMSLTVDVLTSTEIGKAVNALRKHSSSTVRHLAKQLIGVWTEMVDEWVNATTQIVEEKNGGTPDSINPSVLDEEEGLPSPPMDEGAFFITPQDIELSEFFDGMDDDGNLQNSRKFSKNCESGRKPLYDSQNTTKPKSRPTNHNDVLRKDLVKVNVQKNHVTISKPTRPSVTQSGPGRPQKTNAEPHASSLALNKTPPQRKPTVDQLNKPRPTEVDLEATKRRLHESYEQAENAKRQRTIQVLDIIPKQPVSHSRKSQGGRTCNSNRSRLFGRR